MNSTYSNLSLVFPYRINILLPQPDATDSTIPVPHLHTDNATPPSNTNTLHSTQLLVARPHVCKQSQDR